LPEPGYLLDANVLIALSDASHLAHGIAEDWFNGSESRIATCPITQGALLRYYFRVMPKPNLTQAQLVLGRFTSHSRHIFIHDDISYLELPPKGVVGYRNLTDAYLVALARHHNALVATLDEPFANTFPAATLLLSPG
jgi:uncharacterized protein